MTSQKDSQTISGCLALTDVDHIKSFIFAAPYLREIRGGSGILARLNDPTEPKEVSERVTSRGGELLYAGGGSVLARFPAWEEASAFLKAESLKLEEQTKGGARMTGVIAEVDAGGFGPAIIAAQSRLREAKARRAAEIQSTPCLLYKPCQACGARPAEQAGSRRDWLVCPPCEERSRQGGERAESRRLYAAFKAGFDDTSRDYWHAVVSPGDLNALASSSKGYIGVIQADGNAIGERVRLLAEIGDEKLFGRFSEECRQATEGAVLSALRAAYPEPRKYEGKDIYPFEFVLLGGDDVEIITTAEEAITIAVSFCEAFTERMSRFAENSGHPELAVAMSAGVVLAQSSYPITSLDNIAGQLLRAAKASSRRLSEQSLIPTIDFMVVTASSTGTVEAIRSKEYRQHSLRFTQRPYTTRELSGLINALGLMKRPPRGATPFPRNKLRSLYEMFFPFRGKEQAELEYLLLQKRLSDKGQVSHREMLRHLNQIAGVEHPDFSFWREVGEGSVEFDTCLVDAVEIYEFLPRRFGQEQDAAAED